MRRSPCDNTLAEQAALPHRPRLFFLCAGMDEGKLAVIDVKLAFALHIPCPSCAFMLHRSHLERDGARGVVIVGHLPPPLVIILRREAEPAYDHRLAVLIAWPPFVEHK